VPEMAEAAADMLQNSGDTIKAIEKSLTALSGLAGLFNPKKGASELVELRAMVKEQKARLKAQAEELKVLRDIANHAVKVHESFFVEKPAQPLREGLVFEVESEGDDYVVFRRTR